MPLNQWKFLIGLKDSFSKITNDKNLQNVLGKDTLEVIYKFPVDFSNSLMKYIGQISSLNRIGRYDGETVGNLPTILKDFNSKIKLTTEAKPTPKWKSYGRMSKVNCHLLSKYFKQYYFVL